MSGESDKSLGIGLIMAVIVAPVLAPEFFIFVGTPAWAIFYTLIWLNEWGADFSHVIPHLNHWGFDPTETLPSMFAASDINEEIKTAFWLTVVVAAVGLLGGLRGVIAMICAWAPMFFLGAFSIAIGTSVIQSESEWIESNYTQESCDKAVDISPTQISKLCLFVPKPGKKLPYFTKDVYNQGVGPTKVVPYYQFNKDEPRIDQIKSTQPATQVKTADDLSFSNFFKRWVKDHIIPSGIFVLGVIVTLLT